MSKKLAVGPSHLLLDVKVGEGAFMKTLPQARKLARTMVAIGEDAGVRTRAVLSAMRQPLGRAVGNALEVAEAIAILRGQGPADVTELCHHEAVTLLTMAGVAASHAAAERLVADAISSGAALAKFAAVVVAQGGDAAQVEDPALLPAAPVRQTIAAPRAGYIAGIDAERVGLAAMRLGAGRARKEDSIDHAVGLVLHAKIGDRVPAGAPLLEVHARTEQSVSEVRADLLAAYAWSDAAVDPGPLILGMVEQRTK
jgi:thymidine phosphorylase